MASPPSAGSPRRTRAARYRRFGLRLYHAAELNTPLYVFETNWAKGTVASAAREVVSDSRIPYARYASDTRMNHLDPLFAATAQNTLTHTLTPFLTGLG